MSDWEGRRNFSLNAPTILRDLYRLAAMFFGDHALMHATTGEDDPLRRLREQHVEDELLHLLVVTAVKNRIQFEHMSGPRNDPQESSFAPFDNVCGQLRNNVDTIDWKPLPFKEACNKIVHAHNIVVQFPSPLGRGPIEPTLTTTVSLRGDKYKKTWLAHIDVVEYVRASFSNFDD